jgi:hypothetical protein
MIALDTHALVRLLVREDLFVSSDRRQRAAARKAELRTKLI